MAIHNHRFGFDYYPFFFEDGHEPINEEFVLANAEIDFEPDREEDITILDPIDVPVIIDPLFRDLIVSAETVINRWETGDLAEAVRKLSATVAIIREKEEAQP